MGEKTNLKQDVRQLSGEIQKTTELFYMQRETEGYQAFGMVLPLMAGLLDSLFTIQAAEGKPEFNKQEFVRLMTEAVGAMEAKDGILLADILQYDFLDQLDLIEKQL